MELLTIALLQPQFAPNLFDLAAMLRTRQTLWLDTDIWSRKGRTHRAKIRGEHSAEWLNIPIKTDDKKKPIRQVRIDHSFDWFTPFWNGILHNYSSATYFDFYYDELYAELKASSEYEFLIDFNTKMFTNICRWLEITPNIELMSHYPKFDLAAQPIIQEYRSKNYIRQWPQALPHPQQLPEYTQAGPGFIPECSVLDLMLNHGPESFRVLELLK